MVNEENVVFGLLREKELGLDPDSRVEIVMRAGPSTFRPHVPIDEMARFMIEHDLPSAPVTTSDGRLVGLLMRKDAAAAALELRGNEERDG